MKREILFRGKRVDNGEWVYGRGLQQCKDELGNEIVAIFTDVVKSEKYIKKEGRYTLYYVPVKAETLGRYTGLKDKNGNKIFEGDILELTVSHWFSCGIKYKGVVKYSDLGFVVYILDDKFELGRISYNKTLKIIGNIFESKYDSEETK